MRKIKLIWQIGSCEPASFELRDDMKDLASQLGVRIGLSSSNTDDQFRTAVVAKARRYNIELTPDQVTVEHTGSGIKGSIYLRADYTVPIHLPGFDFTPESGERLY